MSKFRRAARIDENQNDIVRQLRKIPNLTVAVGHDDILVGYRGRTYWFEIKNPSEANKAGKVRKSSIKESQHKLLASWAGHYSIVTTFGEILREIGLG